jgi:hypothetical protein
MPHPLHREIVRLMPQDIPIVVEQGVGEPQVHTKSRPSFIPYEALRCWWLTGPALDELRSACSVEVAQPQRTT